MIASILGSVAFKAVKSYWPVIALGVAVAVAGFLVWRNHTLAAALDEQKARHLAERAALMSEIVALEVTQQILANSLVSAQERRIADEARARDVFDPIEREVANGQDAPMAGVMLDGLASLRDARANHSN